MKCPEEKIYYGVICERFPEPSVYFETFESAIRWAKSEQPAYRPYYIVECVEHYEICGSVDDKKETKEMKDENKTYEQGLSDAWEAAKKIVGEVLYGGFTREELQEIFGEIYASNIMVKFTAAEATAKIKAYEDKQKEIKVGDEVYMNFAPNETGIVTRIYPKGKIYIMWEDGACGRYDIINCKKTGRHFPQVEELLKAMKEGQ